MVRTALTAALVTLLLAGCGAEAGDGDLVDDWATMAAAEPKVPAVACYDSPIRNTVDINTVPTPPRPCEQAHTVETFHVGRFPDAVAAAPAEGSLEYWAAFEECERLAADFLGGRWYDTLVDLAINVPTETQWGGGGRWYRCELMETGSSGYTLVRRTGTLRGAGRPESPLVERCANLSGVPDSGYEYVVPVACDAPHDAEYAGAFRAEGTAWPQEPLRTALYERCWDLVATYLGGTRDGIRLGRLSLLASQRAWIRGDRYVRCYAWRAGGKLTGTVKGLGNAAPR